MLRTKHLLGILLVSPWFSSLIEFFCRHVYTKSLTSLVYRSPSTWLWGFKMTCAVNFVLIKPTNKTRSLTSKAFLLNSRICKQWRLIKKMHICSICDINYTHCTEFCFEKIHKKYRRKHFYLLLLHIYKLASPPPPKIWDLWRHNSVEYCWQLFTYCVWLHMDHLCGK